MIPDRWIDEAGDELASYNNEPFLRPFMERWGLNPDAYDTLTERIEAIKACIRAPDHPLRLDDLAEYLDELKNHGRQVIFLWHLKPGEEAYLHDLAKLHPERNHLVWETKDPKLAELAEVKHERNVLRFKWIASRRYFVILPAKPGAPPVVEQRTQRATTFFKVDLNRGEAELRIQSLPAGRGLPSHRKEFELYQSEVKKYVDLNHFAPVLIEPVASAWLRTPSSGLVITTWAVARPSGEYMEGGGRQEGNLAESLNLVFGNYAAKRLTLRWDCEQKIADQPLFFTLDGFTDGIDFNGRADASRVDFLLDRIRHGKLPSFQMRELRLLAERHPEHARILVTLDQHFAILQNLRISAEVVAEGLWYDIAAIRRVFELAATEFPKAFTLQGEVLVLKNRFRIGEGGLVETVERFAKAKGHPKVRASVKPAMMAVTPLAVDSYNPLLSWLWSRLMEELTGVSFDDVEAGLVALVIALHLLVMFGGAWIKKLSRRLLELARSFYSKLQSLKDSGNLLATAIEAAYREWLSALPSATAPKSVSDHWKAAA